MAYSPSCSSLPATATVECEDDLVVGVVAETRGPMTYVVVNIVSLSALRSKFRGYILILSPCQCWRRTDVALLHLAEWLSCERDLQGETPIAVSLNSPRTGDCDTEQSHRITCTHTAQWTRGRSEERRIVWCVVSAQEW